MTFFFTIAKNCSGQPILKDNTSPTCCLKSILLSVSSWNIQHYTDILFSITNLGQQHRVVQVYQVVLCAMDQQDGDVGEVLPHAHHGSSLIVLIVPSVVRSTQPSLSTGYIWNKENYNSIECEDWYHALPSQIQGTWPPHTWTLATCPWWTPSSWPGTHHSLFPSDTVLQYQ